MSKTSKGSSSSSKNFAKKIRKERQDVQICNSCGKYKTSKEFYISENPEHETGYVPYCKTCVRSMCSNPDGTPSKSKLIKLLQTLDRPYIDSYWETCLAPNVKNNIGVYFRCLNMKQYAGSTWADSDFDKLNEDEKDIKPNMVEAKIAQPLVTHLDKFENFKVDDNIISLFGIGYTDEEYFRMNEKYNFLMSSYKEPTHLHTESLLSYVRYKVKEEIAISKNKPSDAKIWGDLAMRQAEKAKINPNQFSQSDLQGGLSTIGELAEAVEQHQDIIQHLPQFKYRPNDAVDFCIWNYINYVRELEGKPLVDYEEVYKFYDKRKQQYIKTTGDPYGIFKDDPTKDNRKKVKTFIQLPDDYNNKGNDE